MYEIVSAVYILGQYGIIHRDIKPDNILIKEGIIKLADFGYSIFASESSESLGTPIYMAPEVVLNKRYNGKIDVWSLGVMWYELLAGSKYFLG